MRARWRWRQSPVVGRHRGGGMADDGQAQLRFSSRRTCFSMATMHQLRAVGSEGGCSHSPASQPQALHTSSRRRTRYQRLQPFHAAKDGSQAAGAAGAAAGSAAAPPAAAAAAAAVEYDDNWSDVAFIALCRIAYGRIAGYQSSRRCAPVASPASASLGLRRARPERPRPPHPSPWLSVCTSIHP